MLSNAAVTTNWSDLIADLGSIPSDRILHEPSPGHATKDDAIRVNRNGRNCELAGKPPTETEFL